jgi:hypothetical protein
METMEQTEKARGRRNVAYAFGSLVVVVGLALLPAYCRSQVEPEAHYTTLAQARTDADADRWLPGFLPPSAADIYERHGRYRRFVRFEVDSVDVAPLLSGMTQLDTAAARRVPAPMAGWSGWWPITPQTLQSGQGKQVKVYRVDAPPRDRGYLVLDPRTLTAYYWSTDD